LATYDLAPLHSTHILVFGRIGLFSAAVPLVPMASISINEFPRIFADAVSVRHEK
jgi:hypothetical protein